MSENAIIVLIAIVLIATIEFIALHRGFNGKCLRMSVASISLLVGYLFGITNL